MTTTAQFIIDADAKFDVTAEAHDDGRTVLRLIQCELSDDEEKQHAVERTSDYKLCEFCRTREATVLAELVLKHSNHPASKCGGSHASYALNDAHELAFSMARDDSGDVYDDFFDLLQYAAPVQKAFESEDAFKFEKAWKTWRERVSALIQENE